MYKSKMNILVRLVSSFVCSFRMSVCQGAVQDFGRY